MRLPLVTTALILAAVVIHHTTAQTCDDLEEALRTCRMEEEVSPTPSSGFTCDGFLNGDGDVCCAAGCGECGGVGCSDRGGGLDKYDCCVSDIRIAGSLCSVTGEAPCLVDRGDSAPTPSVPAPTPSSGFTCDGVLNGDGDVCCAAGCGECGGAGCSDRGGGLDKYDCCTSDIREAGSLCSVTGKAPCLVEGGDPAPTPTVPAPTTPAPATPATTPTPVYEPSTGDGTVWVPKVGDTWQYNLDTPVDTTVDADVFFIDSDWNQETIDELHAKGKSVSCYISVGTVESWREDVDSFPSSAVGNASVDSGEERFVDITNESVKEIMVARIKKAARSGCDAVEPDKISTWSMDTGLTISKDEQISYTKWVVEKVRENGMLVGMKNAVDLIGELSDEFDFAVTEQCHVLDVCDEYVTAFLEKGKPVFNVEYSKDYGVCPMSNELGIDTIFKNYDLLAPVCSCADASRDLDCDEVRGFAPTPSTPPPTSDLIPVPQPTPSTPPPTSDLIPVPQPTPEEGSVWVPKVGDTWQYNLNTPVDTNVDADVFFINMDGAQATIDELHGKGKFVSCYISTGTVESYRDDAGAFPSDVIGNSWGDWASENYLDIRQQVVRDLMEARVEKAAGMNCDAIEPDNMSNWNQKDTGFVITKEEQIDYNRWFAELVHEKGMLIGMKNAIELLPDLSSYYDFGINEECFEWNECSEYTIPFLSKGIPVFNVEYDVDYGLCTDAGDLGLDTIFKNYDLNAAFCSCADPSRDMDCSDVTG